jgi:transcriptional regulator with XRE-family HTH domain
MNNSDLHKKIGLRIKMLRNEHNISQQNLAAKCNFEKSNMSRIESGNVNATISTLNEIAVALNIHLMSIFDFSNLD